MSWTFSNPISAVESDTPQIVELSALARPDAHVELCEHRGADVQNQRESTDLESQIRDLRGMCCCGGIDRIRIPDRPARNWCLGAMGLSIGAARCGGIAIRHGRKSRSGDRVSEP